MAFPRKKDIGLNLYYFGKNWAKNWVNWRIFYEVITQLLRDYFVQKSWDELMNFIKSMN